jgi:hypothetical protein
MHNMIIEQLFQRLTDNQGVSAVPSIPESDDDRFSYTRRPDKCPGQVVAPQRQRQIRRDQSFFGRH